MPSNAPDWWRESQALALLLSGAWRKASHAYFERAREAVHEGGIDGVRDALKDTESLSKGMGRVVGKKPLTLLLLALNKGSRYWSQQIAKAKRGRKAEHETLKFNPNHDEKGRFASSDSASNPTQRASVNAIIDELSGYSSRKEKLILLNHEGIRIHEETGDENSVGSRDLIKKYGPDCVLLHTHPDPYSFSVQDISTAKLVGESIVVAHRHKIGPVVFKAEVTRPWSGYEWNSEILPKLERKEKTLAREWNREFGDNLNSGGPIGHALWTWATTKGPLKDRMNYSVSGNTEGMWTGGTKKSEATVKDDYQDRIADAVTRQINAFVAAHPDRILQPEIERQLAYLSESNLTTTVDVSDVLDRLEALSDQDEYWARLSDVQVARAWHGQSVLMSRDAGMTRMVVSGPDDEKTCEVCRRMIGQEFPVDTMADKVESDLDLEDVDDYISAWTFPRLKDVDNISREDLANKELFPPYHPHCRHSVAILY